MGKLLDQFLKEKTPPNQTLAERLRAFDESPGIQDLKRRIAQESPGLKKTALSLELSEEYMAMYFYLQEKIEKTPKNNRKLLNELYQLYNFYIKAQINILTPCQSSSTDDMLTVMTDLRTAYRYLYDYEIRWDKFRGVGLLAEERAEQKQPKMVIYYYQETLKLLKDKLTRSTSDNQTLVILAQISNTYTKMSEVAALLGDKDLSTTYTKKAEEYQAQLSTMQSKFSAPSSSSGAPFLPKFAPQPTTEMKITLNAEGVLSKYILAISTAVNKKYTEYLNLAADGNLSDHEEKKKNAMHWILQETNKTQDLMTKLQSMESYLADESKPEIQALKAPGLLQKLEGSMWGSAPASSDTYAAVVKATFELRCDLQKIAPGHLPKVPENLKAHYEFLAQSSSSAGPARKYQ